MLACDHQRGSTHRTNNKGSDMNRAAFTLAHQLTRNTVRKGDCYRTTFAAALRVAREALQMALAALATIGELEACEWWQGTAIMGRAERQSMAAADLLCGPVVPGAVCYVAKSSITADLEEASFALVDENASEAMELLFTALLAVGLDADRRVAHRAAA